jgi:hypothetical protein
MFTSRFNRHRVLARLATVLARGTLPAERPGAAISRVRAATRIEDALRSFERCGLRTRVVAPRGEEGPVAVNLVRYDRATARGVTLAWVEVLLDGSVRLDSERDPPPPELARIAQTVTEAFRGTIVQARPRDLRTWSVGALRVRQALTGAWSVEDAEGHILAVHDALEEALASARDDQGRPELDDPLDRALALETTAKTIAAAMREDGVTALVQGAGILVQDEAGRHLLTLSEHGLRVPASLRPRTLDVARRAARAHLPAPSALGRGAPLAHGSSHD